LGGLYFLSPLLGFSGLLDEFVGARGEEGRAGILEYGLIFSLIGALVLEVGKGAAKSLGMDRAYSLVSRAVVAGGLCLAGGDGAAGISAFLPEHLRLRLYGRKTLAGGFFCFLGSALYLLVFYDWCTQTMDGTPALAGFGREWNVWSRVLLLAYISAVVEGLPFWGPRDNPAVFLACSAMWALWEASCSAPERVVANPLLCQTPAFWAAAWSVLALAVFTWNRKKFTPMAALTGFVVSVLHLCTSWAGFGALMLFVISGIAATRFGKDSKSQLVSGDEHDETGGQSGNRREARRAHLDPDEISSKVLLSGRGKSQIRPGRRATQVLATSVVQGILCVFSSLSHDPASRQLFESAAVVGYAVALADTLGSEIGMTFPGNVCTLWPPRRVRPGTNGGLSLIGSLAALAGGVSMGVLHCAFLAASPTPEGEAAIERCVHVIIQDTMYAVLGMLVDSILGSSLQFSGVDSDGRITNDPGKAVEVIFPRNVLSNTMVNFLSIALVCGVYLVANWRRTSLSP